MIEVKCPSCGTMFLVKEFTDILCPGCSREASWDYTEDTDIDDNGTDEVWYPEWNS